MAERRFLPVEHAHVMALGRLKVAPDQVHLASPAIWTLAEAAYHPSAIALGIWDGEEPVGLMALVDPAGAPAEELDDFVYGAAHLWRLMVSEAHQGRGHGAAALVEAARIAAGWGYDGLSLTVAPDTVSARGFYERYGFRATGRVLWNEIEMARLGAA